MNTIRKILFASSLGLALGGASFLGCEERRSVPSQVIPVDPNAPIVKIENIEGYKEAMVVGRDYTPGFSVNKNVRVSYHKIFGEANHDHDVPIEVSQPERYFLFVELDNKTFTYEVDKTLFRDAPNNGPIIANYSEKRQVTYKHGAEAEKVNDEFNGLEIISLELKK